MTRPRRFLVRMAMFLGVVAVILGFLFGPLREAFLANTLLNGLILGVLFMGIFYNVRQVIQLYPETDWIESFRRDHSVMSRARDPKLLAPMATMLGEQGRPLKLSAMSMRSLLDGISARLEESRDISRYTIGLLIFLGLLGTFWGLLQTVSAVGDVIARMSVEGGDLATMFGDLKSGLAAPLSGMGTAFSTSLFGLGGSLVLGFLDLQAGQAQNHFYNDLEDWLSSLTRLSSGALSADGDHSVPAYVQALLEQSAESLENLQRTLTRGEEHRISANDNLMALMEKLETLTDHMRTEQALMMRLADNQMEMKPILSRLSEINQPATGELDEATRAHIRNLDVYMARLVDDISAGREQIIQQVRSEIKLLARTIAAIADEAER